jgi:hypothetical protein
MELLVKELLLGRKPSAPCAALHALTGGRGRGRRGRRGCCSRTRAGSRARSSPSSGPSPRASSSRACGSRSAAGPVACRGTVEGRTPGKGGGATGYRPDRVRVSPSCAGRGAARGSLGGGVGAVCGAAPHQACAAIAGGGWEKSLARPGREYSVVRRVDEMTFEIRGFLKKGAWMEGG